MASISIRMHKWVLSGLTSLLLSGAAAASGMAQTPLAPPPLAERAALPHRPGSSAATSESLQAVQASVFPWSRVVFQSFRDENWEIYASNDDGTNQVRLTNSGGPDIHPAFNRGASRVVYASKTGDYEIRLVNADGSSDLALTDNGADDVHPAWSPDGSRIAFQSYRDGQAEIYVMQANGAGQTRLTSSGDYDGEPAWSPDGSRIAFVSRRTGQYALWVMNADGSGQTQLAAQSYSENPTWSPDGSQIAYDADGNGDGWQELWVVNADGSQPHAVFTPAPQSDVWAGSWSPDGRYVACTYISFVYYENNWYWTTAYLRAWDSATGGMISLSPLAEEWSPDWQTTDILAPATGMAALNSPSPAPIHLTWSGSDAGPAGLKSYDVQVRNGLAGNWVPWLTQTTLTATDYPGQGGQTYYFRVRARDHSSNVEPWPASHDAMTTVESLPPVSAVEAVPAFVRPPLVIRWSGMDPGLSGIRQYDVQYRAGAAGDWLDWQMGTSATQAVFTGTPGETYYFRARAADLAQNLESWPAGDGDSRTTLYDWQVSGVVRDNAGAPVGGAQLLMTPAALNAALSDVDGGFAAYALSSAAPYTAAWSKSGYGSLPAAALSLRSDSYQNVVLPPQDNVIRNWGFETGAASWNMAGTLGISVTSAWPHTGGFAAQLGADPWPLTDPEPAPAGLGAMAFSPDGALHVAWAETDGLRYRQRSAAGDWSAVDSFDSHGINYLWIDPQLHFLADGALLMVWRDFYKGVVWAVRNNSGQWSAPAMLPVYGTTTYRVVSILDRRGQLHVLWTTMDAGAYYARRNAAGQWSAPEAAPASGAMVGLAVDSQAAVHLVWSEIGGSWIVQYAARDSAGTWSVKRPLSNGSNAAATDPQIAIDAADQLHVIWHDGAMGIQHTLSAGNGLWAEPVNISAGIWASMTLDPAGNLHVVWLEGRERIKYRQRSADGLWSFPVEVNVGVGEFVSSTSPGHRLVVNERGLAVVTWAALTPASRDVYFAARDSDGNWSLPRRLGPAGLYTWIVEPALDGLNNLHVMWHDGGSNRYYVGPGHAAAAGQASLQQSVTVPAGLLNPRLSFAYQFGGALASGDNAFKVNVAGASGLTTLTTITLPTNGWAYHSLDLSAWSDQTITITFQLLQAANAYPAWALVDEVSLGSSYPDVWVKVHNPAAHRGENVVYTLTFGNQGGAPAHDAQITFTLPVEVELISTSAPPAASSPALTWEVGVLPPGAGPQTISVTGRVAADVPIPSLLHHSAGVQCSTMELEALNNVQLVATRVEPHALYLPLIRR